MIYSYLLLNLKIDFMMELFLSLNWDFIPRFITSKVEKNFDNHSMIAAFITLSCEIFAYISDLLDYHAFFDCSTHIPIQSFIISFIMIISKFSLLYCFSYQLKQWFYYIFISYTRVSINLKSVMNTTTKTYGEIGTVFTLLIRFKGVVKFFNFIIFIKLPYASVYPPIGYNNNFISISC